MLRVWSCLTQQHDLRLVLVAVLICGVACFASLTLVSRGGGRSVRLLWLGSAALAFGSGTWAAHFISMLAFAPDMPMAYDMTDTVASIAIAVIGSSFGLALFQNRARSWLDTGGVALALGASVGAMHLVGMEAVRIAGRLQYDPGYIVAGLVVGAIFFGLAFRTVPSIDTLPRRLIGAGFLTLGILALHYTAMAAVTIVPDPTIEVPEDLIATGPLATGIALVGFAILAVGLIAARFDQRAAFNAERELARFRQLTDATFSGVLVYRDGVILDVNAALCSFMKCEESDLIGHKVSEFVAPHCLARFAERISSGQLENEEFDVIVKTGEQHTVEVITRVVDYRSGTARVTAIRDVTERKRDELLRAEEHRLLTGIAENRPLAETLTQVCRLAEAAMPGSICSVLLVGRDDTVRPIAGPSLPAEYSSAIDGGPIGPAAGSCGTAAYRKETVVVEDIATDPLWADYKDYALKHNLRACWSIPLIAKDGRVIGTFANYHNRPYRPSRHDFLVMERLAASAAIAIQRSQMHEDLIAARDTAEAASRAKSQFLANMSHELRTPLNAILGFSEIIATRRLGSNAQDRYVEYARDIHDSGTYLLSLINDVLDVARVEAGKVEINRTICNVADVIEEQLRLVRRAYPDAAPIAVRIAPDCPDLLVDHRAFGQVLINVLGNAEKFSPPGGAVTVTADWDRQGFRLNVEDEGPGIPANKLEELGKPFHQVENAYSRRHSGTGLGLYISRSLMRLHGGEMTIASTLGKGTTVTLAFPEEAVVRNQAKRAAVGE